MRLPYLIYLIVLFAAIATGTCASGQTVTSIYDFGARGDGSDPFAGVVLDTHDNLFGTTAGGGLSGNGTVFELTPPATPGGAWIETILHKFHGSDGSTPEGRVLLMPTSSGREVLFGTTYQGGPNNAGVAFELSPSNTNDGWTEHIIYAFGAYARDAANPNHGLLSAGGHLFGVSFNGGAHAMGAVFELTPPAAGEDHWTEDIIHSFAGGNDGAFPSSELAIDSAGNLYGATTLGGAANDGTVYRLHPPVQSGSRWAESVLHAFSGPDGSLPAGRLAIGPGVLYGTSASGGDFSSGTVFQLAPPPSPGSPWTETVLYSFTGGRDGDEPSDGVLADTQGRLLGTALHGGTHTGGVVFALLPPAAEGAPWKEVVLHSFRGADGFIPHSRLAFSPGAIYGATQEGGALRRGNVFVLNP